jgi:hypothetical protein
VNLQTVRGLLAAAIYALSTTASALTIGQSPATEVGVLDLFVSVSAKNELPNSNPTSEENWIESVLVGKDVTYIQVGEDVPITASNEDPTAFVWQLVTSDSDYFLVKNAGFWALFENRAEKSYAVVDADSGLLPDKMNFGDATISHYGLVNGGGGGLNPPSEVPIPAPFALIGIGLAGLGWIRRSKV